MNKIQYEVGDRVLVYYNEGDVEKGRKLRCPWIRPYRVTSKVPATNYILSGEATGTEAQSHVNRMAKFYEMVSEDASKVGGLFSDTRKYIRSILDMRIKGGQCQLNVLHSGRNG